MFDGSFCVCVVFEGIRQRCSELYDRGLLRVDTIDGAQGGQADSHLPDDPVQH